MTYLVEVVLTQSADSLPMSTIDPPVLRHADVALVTFDPCCHSWNRTALTFQMPRTRVRLGIKHSAGLAHAALLVADLRGTACCRCHTSRVLGCGFGRLQGSCCSISTFGETEITFTHRSCVEKKRKRVLVPCTKPNPRVLGFLTFLPFTTF